MLLTWDQYVTRWSGLHGGVDPRAGSPLVRGWLRLAYQLGRALARLGVRPATVTAPPAVSIRATAAGMREIGVVTVAERPTRAIVVAVGLLMSGLAGLVKPELVVGTATVATAALALFGVVGLGQLAAAVQTALAPRH